jgi:hypothetical protein
VKYFIEKAPAKWAALVQALVAVVAVFVDGLPVEAVVTLILAATGLGFAAQKIEDEKTYDAFLVDPEIKKPRTK